MTEAASRILIVDDEAPNLRLLDAFSRCADRWRGIYDGMADKKPPI